LPEGGENRTPELVGTLDTAVPSDPEEEEVERSDPEKEEEEEGLDPEKDRPTSSEPPPSSSSPVWGVGARSMRARG